MINNLTPVDDNLMAVKEEFYSRIKQYKESSEAFVVNSPGSFEAAGLKSNEGLRITKGIKDKIDPIVKERHAAHKEATAFKKGLIEPIESGSKALLAKMNTYRIEKERQEAAELKRLEEEAQKKREEECLKQAADMEKEGAPVEAVDAVLSLADDPAPEVHMATPVLRSRTSFIPDWEVAVFDKAAVPEEYKVVDLAAIKKVVKAQKGQSAIPGIRITTTTTMRRSGR